MSDPHSTPGGVPRAAPRVGSVVHDAVVRLARGGGRARARRRIDDPRRRRGAVIGAIDAPRVQACTKCGGGSSVLEGTAPVLAAAAVPPVVLGLVPLGAHNEQRAADGGRVQHAHMRTRTAEDSRHVLTRDQKRHPPAILAGYSCVLTGSPKVGTAPAILAVVGAAVVGAHVGAGVVGAAVGATVPVGTPGVLLGYCERTARGTARGTLEALWVVLGGALLGYSGVPKGYLGGATGVLEMYSRGTTGYYRVLTRYSARYCAGSWWRVSCGVLCGTMGYLRGR